MKKVILLILVVFAFTLHTNAQDLYIKAGPSIAIVEQAHVDEEPIVFAGVKAELGFDYYFIQHGVYGAAYLNNTEKGMGLTKQTMFDMGYVANIYPNFYGHKIGYFGTGLQFRVSEHDTWNPNYPDNDYYSWNVPLRGGGSFLPSSQIRIYIEGEYSIYLSGNKFHAVTLTLGVQFK